MKSSLLDISKRIKLNDGNQIPIFGLGTYKASDSLVANAVANAIQMGYRLIDTAEFYNNEEGVGKGIRESGVARDKLFVVTKLWEKGGTPCRRHFLESLKKLNLDYVDLYLIHHPFGGKIVETYSTIMQLRDQGLIRSVGVSNFGVHHLENMKAANLPIPAVNQIELHPWLQQRELVDYCLANGILPMGYCPLARAGRMKEIPLNEISLKYERTPAQILIRWSLQSGFVTIPKSADIGRIKENCDVFDFDLADEDMKILNSFYQSQCTFWNPLNEPWVG